MDHLLKEQLDLLEEQNNDILDNQALIMDKLGITNQDSEDEDDENEEDKKESNQDLDF